MKPSPRDGGLNSHRHLCPVKSLELLNIASVNALCVTLDKSFLNDEWLSHQVAPVLPPGFSVVTLSVCFCVCSQVPVNLLRAGRIFVFEPPPGVKANMLRTFSSIPVARMCKVTGTG